MQLELTLPCFYALRTLNDYTWRSYFADMQILKKYGVETEIIDFDEFVDDFMLLNVACYEDLHDEHYTVAAYIPKYSHKDLVQQLVSAALEIKTSRSDYYKERIAEIKKEYVKQEEGVKGLVAGWRMDEAIKSLVDQENSSTWRTGVHERLDYHYHRYLNGKQSLEESSKLSDNDNHMRDLINNYNN